MKLIKWFKNQFNKKIDATGLAIFRICYCLGLFFEINRFIEFNHLVFDPIPFLKLTDFDVTIGLKIWMISVFFLIIGAFTRIASIVNYLMSLTFIGTIGQFEYHIFYAYLGINFVLMILPISRVWSIDRLFVKLRYSNSKYHYHPPVTTSAFSYWIPLYVGIALVYFDSIFYKLVDPIWLSGLGLWWPASHLCATQIPLPWLLNQKYLMLFLSYLTLLFEIFFVFLFVFKRFRWTLWFIGMGLHVGILIFFPIPFFAMGVISLYILLIPVGFFSKIKLKFKKPRVTFFYDGECTLCARTKIILEHFDLFGAIAFKTVQESIENDRRISTIPVENLLNDIHSIDNKGKIFVGVDCYKAVCRYNVIMWPIYILFLIPGVQYVAKKIYQNVARNRITQRCTDEVCGISNIIVPTSDEKIKLTQKITLRDLKFSVTASFILIVTIAQLMVSYNSPLIHNATNKMNLSDTRINNLLIRISKDVNKKSKMFLGITGHNVFLKGHFDGYNDVVKVEFLNSKGKLELLPMTAKDGSPGSYCSGFIWAQWTFRAMGPTVIHDWFLAGLMRHTSFWLKQRNSNALNGTFIVSKKKISVPMHWEYGVLERDLKSDNWQVIGEVHWKNDQFEYMGQKVE